MWKPATQLWWICAKSRLLIFHETYTWRFSEEQWDRQKNLMKKGAHAAATMATISSASSAAAVAAAPVGDDGVEQMPRSELASRFIIEQNKFPTELWVIKAATPATDARMGKHIGSQATNCWMDAAVLIRGGRFIWKRQQRRPEDTDGAWFDTVLPVTFTVSIYLMVNRAACVE